MQLRCRSGFGALGAVHGTTLFAFSHTGGIQDATDKVVSDARKVSDTAASYQNNGVFLQVVTFTGDIGGYFRSVGQTDTGNFT
jgi:hypothetical protein